MFENKTSCYYLIQFQQKHHMHLYLTSVLLSVVVSIISPYYIRKVPLEVHGEALILWFPVDAPTVSGLFMMHSLHIHVEYFSLLRWKIEQTILTIPFF